MVIGRKLYPLRWMKNKFHLFEAIVAVTWFRYPASKLQVIGVTGTDGKTTTATLIYHLLKTAGFKVACITTVAAYIGKDLIDTGFHVTTPSSWSLQKLLRRIADQGYTQVVLETTSHGLDQNRVFGTNISLAVITNITHEHLDYHHTLDEYIKAKAKIFQHARVAVLNADDNAYQMLKTKLASSTRLIPYSLKKMGEWREIITRRFPQPYNHQNALAAIAVAEVFKLKKHVIAQAIASFPGVVGRMQSIDNSRGFNIIVDFAHTPNALTQALGALKSQYSGRIIAVFGAAGLRDATKRPLMGQAASSLADEIILTSEDPRTEDPRIIIQQIKSGVKTNHGHVHGIINRREAIAFALKLAHQGDCIGIFGKGHEQSINLDGTHELPWSDVDTVRQLLKIPNH